MEKNNYILLVVCIFLFKLIIITLSYDYYYEPEDVINYINQKSMDKEDLETIVNHLIDTFNDAYVFNEIAINPPQPSFDNNYHKRERGPGNNPSLFSFFN